MIKSIKVNDRARNFFGYIQRRESEIQSWQIGDEVINKVVDKIRRSESLYSACATFEIDNGHTVIIWPSNDDEHQKQGILSVRVWSGPNSCDDYEIKANVVKKRLREAHGHSL